MAHKSHRQKVLQAQLEFQPTISIVSAAKRAPLPKPTPSTSKNVGMDIDEADSGGHDEDADGDVLISSVPATSSSSVAQAVNGTAGQPEPLASSSGFDPLPASAQNPVLKNEFRRITIPAHRMSPLKRDWVNLYTPMVEMLGLQVRMNVKRRAVELKVGHRLCGSRICNALCLLAECTLMSRMMLCGTDALLRPPHIPSTPVPSKKEQISSKPTLWDSM